MNDASSVMTALVYIIAFSQIIILYKLFRISAKLERKSHHKNSQVKRRNDVKNDNRNNQKKRNDNKNKNQNRNKNQNPNQNRNKNQNPNKNPNQNKDPKPKQKPQRQVSSVEKSLRDINLRLKETEEKQDKVRGKLSTNSENSPKPKNDNRPVSNNGNK